MLMERSVIYPNGALTYNSTTKCQFPDFVCL